MSDRPLSAKEIRQFRNLMIDGKLDTMPADDSWYEPEEIYATFATLQSRILRATEGRSIDRCPKCDDETWITKHAPMSDHPDVVDYYCSCRSCDWSFPLREVTEEEKASAL